MKKSTRQSIQNKLYWRTTKNVWMKYGRHYWWGDPLDVRFYLCKELNSVRNKKILDVGCNAGIILNSADDSNIKEGFDLDKDAIKIAKIINKDFNLKADFYVKDVFKSDIKKASFDILILSNVLPSFDYRGYNFEDCKMFVDKCSSYLKKGGVLYLTTPNGRNSYYRKRSKIFYEQLKSLLEDQYTFEIKSWNPLPIQLGHILRYVPGWFSVLEFLMNKKFMVRRCLHFYVIGIKT